MTSQEICGMRRFTEAGRDHLFWWLPSEHRFPEPAGENVGDNRWPLQRVLTSFSAQLRYCFAGYKAFSPWAARELCRLIAAYRASCKAAIMRRGCSQPPLGRLSRDVSLRTGSRSIPPRIVGPITAQASGARAPIAAPVRSRGVFRVPGLLFKVPAISSFAPPVPPTLGGSCKASRLRISTARRYWSLPEESMDGGMRAVELAKSRFGLGMAGRCNSDERTIGYGAVVGAAAPEQRRMLYWLLAQRIPAHGARS